MSNDNMIMDTKAPQDRFQAAELQQMLDTCALEVAYENSSHQTELVLCDEMARQSQLQILLLENENEDLHAQLATDDERNQELMTYCREAETRLEEAGKNLQDVESDKRIKLREIETLKAQLNSLQRVTMDSTKLLTEKLTLARELSTLRPEVEHLRSQAASHQSLLADKLSLQRQLSTCQVELETERRSTQRALAKEGRLQAQDSKFESQLEELHTELAKERRERSKVERQAQKTTTEWENQNATLESRLDSLKNKLRIAKDQLKEEQMKRQCACESTQGCGGGVAASGVGHTTARRPQKRPAGQMERETTFGTPGIHPAKKKSKRGLTLPGDKSTFSITPFLNRTASVAPDSPAKASSNSDEENEPGNANASPIVVNQSSSIADSLRARLVQNIGTETHSQKSVLKGKTKSGQANTGVAAVRKKSEVATSLEQVAEEGDDEEPPAAPIAQTKVPANKGADDMADESVEVRRRKRKFLGRGPGRTLFDEEDDEVHKGDSELPSGLRNFGKLGRVTHGGPKIGERVRLGQAEIAYGTFSPLKRDRRVSVAGS